MTERAEERAVSKQARVFEEVAINKEVGWRTETVRDTVRSTDVEVEEVDTKRTKGARRRPLGASGVSAELRAP